MDNIPFEDFKLKLDYLKAQYDRLLTRFHYFLTIEVALFGFVGWLVFDKLKPGAVRLPAALGAFVSLLWYIVAAEDHALVEEYRDRAHQAAQGVGEIFAANHAARGLTSKWKNPLSWYYEGLSVTRIPVYASFLVLIIWLALLACGPALLSSFS